VQEKKLYAFNGMEIVVRDGSYFVRHDAGAHQVCWREDQISEEEVEQIRSGKAGRYAVFLALQKRIISSGEDPYKSNWIPTHSIEPTATTPPIKDSALHFFLDLWCSLCRAF